jgi:hypothetical protein
LGGGGWVLVGGGWEWVLEMGAELGVVSQAVGLAPAPAL